MQWINTIAKQNLILARIRIICWNLLASEPHITPVSYNTLAANTTHDDAFIQEEPRKSELKSKSFKLIQLFAFRQADLQRCIMVSRLYLARMRLHKVYSKTSVFHINSYTISTIVSLKYSEIIMHIIMENIHIGGKIYANLYLIKFASRTSAFVS